MCVDGPCQKLEVKLKKESACNQVQTDRGGMFHLNKKLQNGRPSWIRGSQAIWYYPETQLWIIGDLEMMGGDEGAGIVSSKNINLNFLINSK